MAIKDLDARVLEYLEDAWRSAGDAPAEFKAELAAAFAPVVAQYEAADPLIAAFSAKAKTLAPATQ